MFVSGSGISGSVHSPSTSLFSSRSGVVSTIQPDHPFQKQNKTLRDNESKEHDEKKRNAPPPNLQHLPILPPIRIKRAQRIILTRAHEDGFELGEDEVGRGADEGV